jgi:hypothetical protein
MTTMQDVATAVDHETHLARGERRVRSRWLTVTHWMDLGVDALVWIAVLAAASGAGLLLESIVDTVRYGAPR